MQYTTKMQNKSSGDTHVLPFKKVFIELLIKKNMHNYICNI